jgi:hypothetical protein
MDQQNSILDRVISSKKSSEIEHFNPSEVVSLLLKNLITREEDVLRRRYGLFNSRKETLEEIGKSYSVTRERIRQIESTAISKIKKNKDFEHIISPIESTVFSVLEQHGGIMNEDSLVTELLQRVGSTDVNKNNLIFLISELLKAKFKIIKPSNDFHQSWHILHAPLHLVAETVDQLIQIIQKSGKPLPITDIISEFNKTDLWQKNQNQLSEDAIISYLEVSPRIAKNPFQEYGFSEWGSIIPKRMNDKIYLVLKRHGKPMHFTEIAEAINQTGFDKRHAYPPTVHNELILNERYVLVGRGIYALKEWGYKPGVVADVLTGILQKENKPLTRKELVEKVLAQRVVKKNTIHLALTDKTKFQKHTDGTYTLV